MNYLTKQAIQNLVEAAEFFRHLCEVQNPAWVEGQRDPDIYKFSDQVSESVQTLKNNHIIEG
jgi:elongation factor P hydroxylase